MAEDVGKEDEGERGRPGREVPYLLHTMGCSSSIPEEAKMSANVDQQLGEKEGRGEHIARGF